nr:hypothetical protein [Lachnospiraceae bacterium]
ILRQQQVGQGQLQGPVMPGAVMQGQAGRRQGVMPGLPNQTRLRQTGSRQIGQRQAGSRQIGQRQAGSRQTVQRQAGSRQTVQRQAGSRQAVQNVLRQAVPVDQEAEKAVSLNVSSFKKLIDSLGSEKYGAGRDILWTEMKDNAKALLADWDQKTDKQRGAALVQVMVSANRYLSKDKIKGTANLNRAKAARQFREFFKATLESMSTNARVLALDEIYKEVDRIDDDENVSPKLKEQNKSVFVELSKEYYRKRKESETKETPEQIKAEMELVDDSLYRQKHIDEKGDMQAKAIQKLYGNTKNYFIAKHKFDFSRSLCLDILADNFVLDRFGQVLNEDRDKLKQWDKLFKDIAEADSKKAVEIRDRLIKRVAKTEMDEDYTNENMLGKKAYKYKVDSSKVLSIQNLGTDWKNADGVEKDIDKWNKEHLNKADKIDKDKYFKNYNSKAVNDMSQIINMPKIVAISDFHNEAFKIYNSLTQLRGYSKANSGIKLLEYDHNTDMQNVKKFMKNNKNRIPLDMDSGENYGSVIMHENGESLEVVNDIVDVDRKTGVGKLKVTRGNRWVYTHQKTAETTLKMMEENKKYTGSKGVDTMIERVKTREDRLNKVERGSMAALEKYCKTKLAKSGDAGKAELAELKKLFEEYMTEAKKQINQREMIDEMDPDAVEKESGGKAESKYVKVMEQYSKQREKMNDLYDRLDEAQTKFLNKYATPANAEKWKKDLNAERKRSQEQEQELCDNELTPAQKVIRDICDMDANISSNMFTEKETEKVVKNYVNKLPGQPNVSDDQKNRVLNALIKPVYRDFTGAFLTETDRKNHEFNKKYKKIMMEGNAEKIKQISTEFVNDQLKGLKSMSLKEIDNLTIENLPKYIRYLANVKKLKLTMFSNVYNKYNDNYPDLKYGFEKMKTEDPGQLKKIEKELDKIDTVYLLEFIKVKTNFDTEKKAKHVDPQKADADTTLQGMRMLLQTQYEEAGDGQPVNQQPVNQQPVNQQQENINNGEVKKKKKSVKKPSKKTLKGT